MAEPTRVGDLGIRQDLAFERRAYRVRQIFGVLFGIVLLAGLLGLLGQSGVLSERTARAGGTLQVDYERFLRVRTPTELDVRVAAGGPRAEVAISQSLLRRVEVTAISAEPAATVVEPDRVVYRFDARPPVTVTFALEPREAGSMSATISGPDGASVSIDQWVWP